jgi:DNA-binding NarL/FixJ family response regulator
VSWLRVVATAETAGEAHSLEHAAEADVALVDIDLTGGSGFETCRWLLGQRPSIAVLMLSFCDWDIYLAEARDAGAAGFLLRSAPASEVIQAIGQVRRGPVFTDSQLERITAWRCGVGEQVATLAPREWEVLWLLSSGITNREIARRLDLSEHTVEKHVSSILHKLGVESRFALLAFIHRHQLGALAWPAKADNC